MATTTRTRMLRLPAVTDRTGLARSTIYALMARGEFPLSRRLTGAVVGWREEDVQEWLDSRVEAPVAHPGRDAG